MKTLTNKSSSSTATTNYLLLKKEAESNERVACWLESIQQFYLPTEPMRLKSLTHESLVLHLSPSCCCFTTFHHIQYGTLLINFTQLMFPPSTNACLQPQNSGSFDI
ncbi:unnamed protein product [Albugo candida]|uniref:Uncharacterized protein n=1 Tax=Albugo candida TaxID=65357 RepID=A0A024FT48_9STRA|nr:unnamed protein product [Albugo candida]|eukprot:CCI10042.1 unnamed protein product [Albugo candida]